MGPQPDGERPAADWARAEAAAVGLQIVDHRQGATIRTAT